VADYVADAVELVKTTNAGPVLIGHSLGALVALGAAAELADRVRAVVLLDPPGPEFLAQLEHTNYPTIWRAMQQLVGSPDISVTAEALANVQLTGSAPGEVIRLGEQRDATALRFMARCLVDLEPETLSPPLENRWLVGFDPFAAAKRIACPVLLIVADPAFGGMMTSGDSSALTDAILDCTRIDLPSVGHLLHWQEPAKVLAALHAFLASLL
jgi:pimeloyl-ACP methyl ester carboxylesterase